jgi:AraC-like DNA-binding protein
VLESPPIIHPRPFDRDFGPFVQADRMGGGAGVMLAIERFSAQPDAVTVANPALRVCRHLDRPLSFAAGAARGRRLYIAPGQHFVFGAGAQQRFAWQDPFRTLSITMTDDFLREVQLPAPAGGVAVRAVDAVLDRLTALVLLEAEEGFPRGEVFAEALGLAIAAHLAACGRTGRMVAPARGALTPRQLRIVREAVEGILPERPRLAELAAIAGIPPQRLGAAFRAATGTSLWDYVAGRRAAFAERLMRDPLITLASVAVRAGYASQAHMTTAFRRLHGMPPSAWRRAQPR